MGIGPAFAIPAALKKIGMTVNDIDVFEINEAFASQAVYCVKKLGVPAEKLNPNGGAYVFVLFLCACCLVFICAEISLKPSIHTKLRARADEFGMDLLMSFRSAALPSDILWARLVRA